MRSRNKSLRMLVAGAVLVLGLGAAQAAVAPLPKEGQANFLRVKRSHDGARSSSGWLDLFRLSWVVPSPRLGLTLPITVPLPRLLGGKDEPLYETTAARKMVDGGDPM